jgi:hypothetical protein
MSFDNKILFADGKYINSLALYWEVQLREMKNVIINITWYFFNNDLFMGSVLGYAAMSANVSVAYAVAISKLVSLV